jgi:phosphatidylinositol kinase/protein kinase (PI-3  family)
MRALRDTAGDVILTVLEVFLWDPLYEWDIVKERQAEDVDTELTDDAVPPKGLARKKPPGTDFVYCFRG